MYTLIFVNYNTLFFTLVWKMNCRVAIVLFALVFATVVVGKSHRRKFHADDPPRCQGGRDGPCFRCLFDCLYCIETWGKREYDGHACSNDCRGSNGENRDEDCSKHMKVDEPLYNVAQ